MKRHTITLFSLVACVALLLMLLPGGVAPTIAQEPEPPSPGKVFPGPLQPAGPYRTPEGHWIMPADAAPPMETAGVAPQATGGPDDFGYTWDDSVSFNWIDAKSLGANSGLYGGDVYTGPVDIGFPFKFYENSYTQLYISTKGLISFGQGGYWYDNTPLPSRAVPDNIIAVFWDDLGMYSGNRPGAGIYIYRGGTAPNRYFVVEWHRADAYSGEGTTGLGLYDLTFEVILYENGDIVMQYHTLSDYLQSATVGIEDDVGVTGLQYLYDAPGLGNNKAIRFYRPEPLARVKAWPLYQSRFTRPGAVESFQVVIRNIGELGADTYDLTANSSWSVTFYAADGSIPLTDTDGDGTVDTGPLGQGESITVTVKVTTPSTAGVGDDNTATIIARSSLDTNISRTVTLQTGIPAPFAQVYQDSADGAMSLYLVQPGAQAVKKATGDWTPVCDMAVAEPSGGFAYFWSEGRCLDSGCNRYVCEIEYTLLDRYGQPVRGVSKLTNHTGATVNTYDLSPAVAVAPNGHIGVTWHRYLARQVSGQWRYNHNIYFAVLNAAGNLIYGPVNLTNNNVWGSWSDLNWPQIYAPRIAATGNNRFVLAWHREYQATTGWVEDIYYAVRDANGSVIHGVTNLTNDTPGWDDGHNGVNLTPLTDNRALLTWFRTNRGIYYAVLNSGGGVVKGLTNLGWDGGGWYYSTDAVQLSDERIVVAWVTNLQVRFATLDANYNRAHWYTELTNPIAPRGNKNVSVAASGDKAVLTWMEYGWTSRSNLYYALVDGNGTVLTPPMIFRTAGISPWETQFIDTSDDGYGNTSYSWTPPTSVDGFIAFAASLSGGPPGGNAAVGLRYANRGTATATGVVLTATLDSNLTYVGDTSGSSPVVSGNDVTWTLPDLDFLADGRFTLYVGVPAGADYGTRYPITLTLTSAGLEANGADNTATAYVMVARQVFLPLVMRNYP